MNRNNPPALLSCHVWPTRMQANAKGLLREVHTAEEGLEARLRAQGVNSRVYIESIHIHMVAINGEMVWADLFSDADLFTRY